MSDYAVIKTGGKQYLVQPGDIIQVERLPYDQGESVKLTDVLLLSLAGEIKVGTPFLEGVSVDAEVSENSRKKKIVVFKYKNKTRYLQFLVILFITPSIIETTVHSSTLL